ARPAHRARDRPERRRLAGAVRAEHRGDLPLLDRERDAVQRLYRTVARFDALELEQGRHEATPRYASITAGSRATSAGTPLAILRPKSSTCTWSEIVITRFM